MQVIGLPRAERDPAPQDLTEGEPATQEATNLSLTSMFGGVWVCNATFDVLVVASVSG